MPRSLPVPLSGISEARRPTGVILGTLVPVAAVFGGLIGPSMLYAMATGASSMPPWMTVVAFGTVILLVFLWVRVKEGRKFASLGFRGGAGASQSALRGAGVGVGLVTIAMLALALFGQAEIRFSGGELGASGWLMALAWIGIFAVQASGEEVAMRGLAMQAYARRLGVAAAIILQAVLFAVLHAGNDGIGILPVLNLILVGIALGCWVVVEGNLWAACAFHAAWNWSLSWLFGATVSGQGGGRGGIFTVEFQEGGNPVLSGGGFGIEGGVVVTVLLAATTLALLRPTVRAVRAAAAGA